MHTGPVDAQFIVGRGNAAISAMFGYNCSMFLSVFGTMFVCPCRGPPLFTYAAVRRDVIRSVRCRRVHFCQRSTVANHPTSDTMMCYDVIMYIV